MRKIVFGAIALIAICKISMAQDESIKALQNDANKTVKSDLKTDGWKGKGTLNITGNQGALSNWAAGGENSTLGINAVLNYIINYKKGKTNWDNQFDIALGMQNATSFGKNFRKSDDRIDITSKLTRSLNSKWSSGVLFNFNSQALPGYSYGANNTTTKISNFLAPGKVLLSAGFDYKPNDKFSLFVSPLTKRWILKSDEDFLAQNKFGVAAGKKTYSEVGAFLSARYANAFTKDKKINYTGRLDLFSNYRRNPKNIDVFMTNLLAMQITKNLATTLSLDVLYDDDVLKKTQLKEILGVGLVINL